MNKAQAIILCAAFFATYPSVDTFFVTTDEQVFANDHDANAHAEFLNKKEPVVITVNRDDKAEGDVLTDEQKAIAAAEATVAKLTTKLAKAAEKNKAGVQAELDAAVKSLADLQAAE